MVRVVGLPVLVVILMLCAVVALWPGVAGAGGPPANDDFPGTAITSLPFEAGVDTAEATAEVDEPVSFCAYDATNTAWWSFTASDTQTLAASAEGSAHPPVLTVWETSGFGGGGLVEVKCDGDPGFPDFPDFPGYPPRLDVTVSFQANAGQTYYIQLGGYEEFFFPFGAAGAGYPPGGPATFRLEALTPPANDDVADAEVITDLPFGTEANSLVATREPDEPRGQCFPDLETYPDQTVWYQWTADSTMEVLIDMMASDFFPFVSVWTGTPGNLVEVTCNFEMLAFEAVAGTTYYIQAGNVGPDWWTLFGGMIRLVIREYVRPACPATTTHTWADPAGDAAGAGPNPADYIGMSVAIGPEAVCVTVQIKDLELGYGAGVDYVFGYLDLDLDQNKDTGSTFPEEPCLPEGRLGYEAYIGFENSGITTVVPVFLSGIIPQSGVFFPVAGLSYEGDTITIAIPRVIIADGNFDIVAELGNDFEITDCMPNDGVASVIQPEAPRFGDVNCSGQVDAGDVRELLAYAGGIDGAPSHGCTPVGELMELVYPLSGQALIAGDVDCDETVDAGDALALTLHLAGHGVASAGCPAPGTAPVE